MSSRDNPNSLAEKFHKSRKIFVIGGTGAQGIPVVRGLVKDGSFSVRILTRDPTSKRAQELKSLSPDRVEFLQGTFASEQDLRTGFQGCYGAFVNLDGFNSGEKTETFWAIRAYELALEAGIKHYVYGNLDYAYKVSGWDPAVHAGHYDGKGRIGEWLLFQNNDAKAKELGHGRAVTTLFTTGPYIEMTIAGYTIMTPSIEEGIVTWRVPLGSGEVAHVSLDDCEQYVRWIFDNPDKSDGLDLQVSIAHIGYKELAEAFSKVTGRPARYVDTSLKDYWEQGLMSKAANGAAGYNASLDDPATMTFKANFSAFWNMWKKSGQNTGIIRRDYKLLDEILPGRIKSAEEFFRREDAKTREKGLGGLWDSVQEQNLGFILKISEDGRKGKL